MKILLLNNYPHYCIGGAEYYSLELVKILKNLGHNLTELCFAEPNMSNASSATPEKNVKVIFVDKKLPNSLFTWIFLLIKSKKKLKEILENDNFDMIISNTVAWTYSKIWKKRLIFIQHSSSKIIFNDKRDFLKKLFFCGSAYNVATDIIVYSKKKIDSKYVKKNTKYWEVGLFSEIGKNARNYSASNLSFVGRLSNEKRLDLLNNLQPKINCSINIVGSGLNEHELNKYSHINFLGRKNHSQLVNDVFPQSKAIILVSDYEGFSFSLIEAMSCGIPIIVRNTFEMAEVLVNEGNSPNGILIPESASINEMAAIINKTDFKKFQSENIMSFVNNNFTYDKFLNAWKLIISNTEK